MKPDLSRRKFLVQSASVAGALGLGGRAANANVDPHQRLRIGFVGLGDRGRHLLGTLLRLQETQVVPSVEITALCDVHPQRLKRGLDMVRRGLRSDGASRSGRSGKSFEAPGAGGREAPDLRGFTNYRALLDCRDVDAVFIATPVHLHVPQTLCALHAEKHLYLEKPLAGSIQECKGLRSTGLRAEEKGLTLQVGFQRRYSPRYRQSIRYVHEGALGAPLFVRAQWHATGNSPKDKPWIFRRDRSGDIVVEQACHQFDVFNWLFESVPVQVCGFGGTSRYHDQPPGRDTMDHYGLVLEYPGGAKVHFSHLSFAVPDRRFSGIYELVFAENGGVDLANAQAWRRDGEAVPLNAPKGNDTELAIASFVEAIRSGQRPVANIDVAYSATMTSILCQQALESSRSVTWKEIEST